MMKRRQYLKTAAVAAAAAGIAPMAFAGHKATGSAVRLGGPVFESYDTGQPTAR